MTAQCITFDEISHFWTRFSDPTVRSDYEQSQHAVLLKTLSQQRFTMYDDGNWEDGSGDFSKPWLCKFDYTKLTSQTINLATVSSFLPSRYICVPGDRNLSATEISRALNSKA